ncbi:MAG: sugar phosphate isomerase/epimerase [Oscillospiraceae bacterium]|nr:sugar phosphate isomerase/epimerase [Oscillospiraceae bacterium]
MKIGISTASLYPLHTEDALLEVAKLGVKNVEIFLNSVNELEGEVFAHMQNTIREYDMKLVAAHPFSTPMETLFLFSSYDRRVNEIMDLYRHYFDLINRLGGENALFVIHGAIKSAKCSDECYIERLGNLIQAGRQQNITVIQENVCYCKSGSVDFLEKLACTLGDSVKFTLDIKQARRSGLEPSEIVRRLKDKITHLHLSDADEEHDCLPLGKGNFDFALFFDELKQVEFKGSAVVELYRDNYGEYSELSDSVNFLKKLLEKP